MREVKIGENDAGQRLDRFLAKHLPGLPAPLAQKQIRLGRVKANGRAVKGGYRLLCGDILSLYISDEFFERPGEEGAYLRIPPPKLDVVYEDANIMLVNKRQGVLCHGGEENAQPSLITLIQAYLHVKGEWKPNMENSFAPALCNRIDRGTGGIVIAAKNAESLRIMDAKIREREVNKYYLCAVHGKMDKPSGTLMGYIWKDAKENRVYVRSSREKGAKEAVTEYRVLEYKNGLSLLECRLITGRTHQIRAQLSAAGHPLLGDGKYGSERANKKYGEKRQALWSYKVEFNFTGDSGRLGYLCGRSFSVARVGFVEKYFDFLY